MSAIWDRNRPEVDAASIVVGKPVTSNIWRAAAHLANFLRGKGACLVPTCMPNLQMEDGQTMRFRFYTRTRSSAIQRVWVLGVRSAGDHATVSVRAPITTGELRTYSVPLLRRRLIVYVEDLTEKASTEGEIAIEISVGEGEVFYVETIACYEQDRPLLNLDSTDLGVDTASTSTSQPIYDAANASIGGIMDALEGADARRASLFQLALGETDLGAGGNATTSAVPASLLPLAVPILGAKHYRTDTTSRAVWRAYVKQAAGTGTVRLTTTESGVDDTLPVTWSSDAWSLPRVIDVDAEDLATADGRQAGAWDDLQVQTAGNGVDALTLKSVSVYTGAEVLDLFDTSLGTFSRESKGTYYYSSAEVSSSFLDFATDNARRLDSREDGLGTTIILEPVGNTNNIAQSEDLTTGDWVGVNGAKFNSGVGFSPDATTNTCDIEFPAGGSSPATAPQAQIEIKNDSGGSVDHTISFWAKMAAGTGKIQARLLRRDGTTYSGAVPYEFDLTDTWQRFSTSQWAGAAGASPLKLCLLNGSDYAARNVQVWGVQVEDGISSTPIQNPSSYIRTVGSTETRALENLRFLAGTNPQYPQAFLTRGFAFTFIPNESSADMLERNNGTGWTGTLIGIASANHYLRFYNNAGSLYIGAFSTPENKVWAGPLTFSADQPIGVEVRPNDGTLRIVGATTGDGTYGATNLLPGSVTWIAGDGVPTISTGKPDPLGGTDAVEITDANAGAILSAQSDTVSYISNGAVTAGVWVKKTSGATNFIEIRLGYAGTWLSQGVLVDQNTGAAAAWGGGTYGNVSVVEEIAGWWHVTFTHSGGTGSSVAMRVMPASGTTYPGRASSATGSATFYAPTIYNSVSWSWPTGTMAIGYRAAGSQLGVNGRWYRYIVGL